MMLACQSRLEASGQQGGRSPRLERVLVQAPARACQPKGRRQRSAPRSILKDSASRSQPSEQGVRDAAAQSSPQLRAAAAAATAACAALFPEAASAALHFGSEPANALSLPTWAIHVASVIEWIVAMDLIWRLGDVQDRPAWRALVWGMMPLHASSLTACTFHFFYNAPSLAGLVTLQAGLTALGNCTLALGAMQVAKTYEVKKDASDDESRGWFAGFQDMGTSFSTSSEQDYLKKGAIASAVGAVAVKYGSLALDLPFEPSYGAALALIFGPTVVTCAVFGARALAGGKGAGGGEGLAK